MCVLKKYLFAELETLVIIDDCKDDNLHVSSVTAEHALLKMEGCKKIVLCSGWEDSNTTDSLYVIY